LNGECELVECLDASGPLKLDELGLSDDGLAALQEALAAKDGLVVIAGPKGSGRAGTVQAIMDDHRRRPEKDPAGPPLVFLGEIADPGTAEMALSSAGTTLTLATTQAVDAPTAVAQLVDHGM